MTVTAEIQLRDMTVEDSDLSYRLFVTSREDDVLYLPLPPAEMERFLREQFDMQHRFYHEHFAGASYQVVERDGVPVGRLYLHRQPDHILVIDIALLPEWRGSGIGSLLMGDIMREAAESGKAVRLHVERFNRALKLYERLGFRPIEDHGIYLFLEWLPG
jgi:ribosomal protein S18 acetylase RimI-like enzyme